MPSNFTPLFRASIQFRETDTNRLENTVGVPCGMVTCLVPSRFSRSNYVPGHESVTWNNMGTGRLFLGGSWLVSSEVETKIGEMRLTTRGRHVRSCH